MSNVFTAIVRIGADAELKSIVGKEKIINFICFNAACNTGYKENKKTMWIRCSYWKDAKNLLPFLLKGSQIFVSGELSQSEFKNKDGEMKTSNELNVSLIEFLSSKNVSNNNSSNRDIEDYDNDIPF